MKTPSSSEIVICRIKSNRSVQFSISTNKRASNVHLGSVPIPLSFPLLTLIPPLSPPLPHLPPPQTIPPSPQTCAMSSAPFRSPPVSVRCARSSSLAALGILRLLSLSPFRRRLISPLHRCPHKHDVCKNSALHPRHDVVHMRNAEGNPAVSDNSFVSPFFDPLSYATVKTFNGCGYCKVRFRP
jgi:hypothetical protein